MVTMVKTVTASWSREFSNQGYLMTSDESWVVTSTGRWWTLIVAQFTSEVFSSPLNL